jgi:DNA repair and recombination protein RAD54B
MSLVLILSPFESALSMPAFQAPVGNKRKSAPCDEPSRKRPAVDSSSPQITPDLTGSEEHWMVLWYVPLDLLRCIYFMFISTTRRNHQYKKHKTWDGDAVLVANAAKATLYDMDGKV